MQYLVLRPFKCFGIRHERGQLISDKDIRCPRILIGEKKIIEAVSSSITPGLCAADIADTIQETKEVKKHKLSFTKGA